MGRRSTLLAGGIAAVIGIGAGPALASHHLVRISEVFPGQGGDANAEFVELQMHAPGQNDFGLGASVELFDEVGALSEDISLADVAAGGSQRTVLIATGDAEDRFAVTADEGYAGDELDPGGGAVCYLSAVFPPGPIDCVAWGSLSSGPPSAGAPAPAIPDGSSLERTIARRCSTWLEPADDTDSSVGDLFPLRVPTPRANAVAPTELACPNTFFTRVPKKSTRKRRANFRFRTMPEGARFHCKLGRGPYRRCRSPYKPRLRPGRHSLRVLALGELRPARYVWRILP